MILHTRNNGFSRFQTFCNLFLGQTGFKASLFQHEPKLKSLKTFIVA